MKRVFYLAPAAALVLAAASWAAGPLCLNHGIHCIEPPPPDCPDCGCPCDKGHRHCSAHKSEHAHKLIDELSAECCCDRIKAVKKLGCRLHADFCCDPEVLEALTHALMCDSCWEVRRAAAWSIQHQNARTEQGVLALYLASKLDPHFLVRDAATDALSVLLVCRRDCFKDLFAHADDLAKSLKGKYKPGSPECFQLMCGCLGGPDHATIHEPPIQVAPPPPAEGKGKSAAARLPAGDVTLQTGDVLKAPPAAAPEAR
jgi:hypothetical protein